MSITYYKTLSYLTIVGTEFGNCNICRKRKRVAILLDSRMGLTNKINNTHHGICSQCIETMKTMIKK